MATHSSIHAWEIPWTEDPGRLQSMGSQRVGRPCDFTSSSPCTDLAFCYVDFPPLCCVVDLKNGFFLSPSLSFPPPPTTWIYLKIIHILKHLIRIIVLFLVVDNEEFSSFVCCSHSPFL